MGNCCSTDDICEYDNCENLILDKGKYCPYHLGGIKYKSDLELIIEYRKKLGNEMNQCITKNLSTCNYCNQTYSDSKLFIEHFQYYHYPIEINKYACKLTNSHRDIVCCRCSTTFKNENIFTNHIYECLSTPLPNTQKIKRVTRDNKLKAMREITGDDKLFPAIGDNVKDPPPPAYNDINKNSI